MANKIDIHGSVNTYNTCLKKLKKDVSKQNDKLISEFLQDLKLGLVGKSKRPNVRTLNKIMFRLKVVGLYMDKINKPIYPISLNALKKFIGDLQDDVIKKRTLKKNASPEGYSERVKLDIKKEYIRFLRHKFGDTEKFKTLTSWIDLTEEKKSIVYFKPEEIKKVISYATRIEDKTIISFLMDTGLRIEETLNIRFEDIRQEG